MTKILSAATLALVAAMTLAGSGQAQVLTKTKYFIGTLNCNVSGSVGLIFGSSKDLSCVFVTNAGAVENYQGSIKKFGVDIGFTKAAHVLWHVYSLGTDRGAGALTASLAAARDRSRSARRREAPACSVAATTRSCSSRSASRKRMPA